MRNGSSLFWLITQLETGSSDGRLAFAQVLRALGETHGNKLRVVLCGGEKLAALKFQDSGLSPLKIAGIGYWPDQTPHDLVQSQPDLSEDAIACALQHSGAHPGLLAHGLRCVRQHPTLSDADWLQTMELYVCDNGLFSRYIEHGERLRQWAQQPVLPTVWNPWPADDLLRSLYWNNLLKRAGRQLLWRCPAIQRAAAEVGNGG